MGFLEELKRRNVLRTGGLYLVGAWVVVQVASTLLPMFGAPEWLPRSIVVLLGLGLIPTLIFAWVYEFTPEGLKRESEIDRSQSITPETGRRIERATLALLAIAVLIFAVDRLVLGPRRAATQAVASGPDSPAASTSPTSVAAPAASATPGDAIPTIEADPSIAVLPFADMSQAKDQEYFSDGISEELLNLLAKVPKLRVIARTSSFSFKGKDVPIDQIARALNVAAVLEGSVRKSNDKVRITVQLIRAIDGTQLWSETYDRTLDDIFAIQDEIAADVVQQLQVTLLGAAPKARTTDPQAYALYLQAVQVRRQNTAEALGQSEALLHRTLAIDPRYAPAWNELAGSTFNKVSLGLLPSKEGFEQSRAAARQALAIDPDYAPAHARLGRLANGGDNDPSAAALHFKRALELDPGDLDVLSGSAVLLATLGRLDEALALQAAIVRRDPVNVLAHYNLGLYQRWAGRFDAAIASYRTALSLAPGRGGAYAEIGNALLLKGDAAGALEEFEQETDEAWKTVGLSLAYHALGRKADADAALSALIAKYEKDAAFNIASVHAFRGEADQAFEWLDKAVAYGDPGVSEIVIESLFANIHQDPRWLPFLRKIGKAPEQLAEVDFKVTLAEAGTP